MWLAQTFFSLVPRCPISSRQWSVCQYRTDRALGFGFTIYHGLVLASSRLSLHLSLNVCKIRITVCISQSYTIVPMKSLAHVKVWRLCLSTGEHMHRQSDQHLSSQGPRAWQGSHWWAIFIQRRSLLLHRPGIWWVWSPFLLNGPEQYYIDMFIYLYILAIQMKLPMEHHRQPGGREDVWKGQPETVFLCYRGTVPVVEVMVIATVKQ